MAQIRRNNNINIVKRLAGLQPAGVKGMYCGYFGWFGNESGNGVDKNVAVS